MRGGEESPTSWMWTWPQKACNDPYGPRVLDLLGLWSWRSSMVCQDQYFCWSHVQSAGCIGCMTDQLMVIWWCHVQNWFYFHLSWSFYIFLSRIIFRNGMMNPLRPAASWVNDQWHKPLSNSEADATLGTSLAHIRPARLHFLMKMGVDSYSMLSATKLGSNSNYLVLWWSI